MINLETFTDEVQKDLEKNIANVIKEGTKELKAKSPNRTGVYASGWTSRKLSDSMVVIYNKKKPGLTHLLEKGTVHSKAKEHIKPVEEWIIDEIEKRTIKSIESWN